MCSGICQRDRGPCSGKSRLEFPLFFPGKKKKKKKKKAISNLKSLCLYGAIKVICGKFLETFPVVLKNGHERCTFLVLLVLSSAYFHLSRNSSWETLTPLHRMRD